MLNKEVSRRLFEIARMLELAEENRFKIRAFENAAHTFSEITDDIAVLDQKDALTSLPGIGKGIAEKVHEYIHTGKIKEHETLAARFPAGLLEVMNLSGLGPKRTLFLFKQMGVSSIQQVREAAEKGKLRGLEGFGAKLEENILKGISLRDEFSKRILLADALRLAKHVVDELKGRCRSIEEITTAGSLRRWKETIGDVDILCASKKPEEVMEYFVQMKEVRQMLARGETKSSVIFDDGMQCDLRVVKPESFGAALLYFTGSKEHNVALRELALKKGFTINEYGLYPLTNKKKAAASRTEKEIYAKLGLEYIPPELRENRGEIDAAARKKLPKLVEEDDVRGDFHNHTRLSDGNNTLDEMAFRAKEKGWEWFVSADHSESLKVAHGLDRKTLFAKKSEITKMNKNSRGFKVLLGSEVDILADGQMDYSDDILKEIDFVTASVHTGFKQNEEQITHRIVSAMKNPHVDIIGHLTGRLINSREAYAVNFAQVFENARATGTALEINGQPQRLDLYDTHAKTAGEMGIYLTLTTDAHSAAQLDNMTFAVASARRAWLTRGQILNCLELDELLKWKGTPL
mgnify:FL=1